MPYLTQARKDQLAGEALPETPGDLNYLLTLSVIQAIKENVPSRARLTASRLACSFLDNHGLDYTNCNAIVGAVECCRRELKRRTPTHLTTDVHRAVDGQLRSWLDNFYAKTVAPYEDKKIEQNGDVYP